VPTVGKASEVNLSIIRNLRIKEPMVSRPGKRGDQCIKWPPKKMYKMIPETLKLKLKGTRVKKLLISHTSKPLGNR